MCDSVNNVAANAEQLCFCIRMRAAACPAALDCGTEAQKKKGAE
jgi:hypothetical protein